MEGSRDGWSTMASRFVTINGDRVAYRLAGRGPALLLIHGMAGSSTTWRHVMPDLAERFTVLAPDLLGQGASDRPQAEYSLGAHVDTLRDLLDALGLERVTLVGQSLGGGLAMQFAYQFPERCERLVLVDAGGLGREVTPLLRMLTLPAADWLLALAWRPTLGRAAELLVEWLGRAGLRAGPAAEEIWRSARSLLDPGSRRAFFRSLRGLVDPGGQVVSARSHLHRLAALPILIVWGAEDRFIPVHQAVEARAALPGSRLELFEGVGHYPHCEDPARFVEVLTDFMVSSEPAELRSRSPGPAASEPAPGRP